MVIVVTDNVRDYEVHARALVILLSLTVDSFAQQIVDCLVL